MLSSYYDYQLRPAIESHCMWPYSKGWRLFLSALLMMTHISSSLMETWINDKQEGLWAFLSFCQETKLNSPSGEEVTAVIQNAHMENECLEVKIVANSAQGQKKNWIFFFSTRNNGN